MEKALIGAGGHAREVMAHMQRKLKCFVEDKFCEKGNTPLSDFDPEKYEVMIAISDSKVRKRIVDNLPVNTKFFSYIHHNVEILDNSFSIEEGSFFGSGCLLTTNISIGKHAILNRSIQIGHDCIIGNFFSAMPGSILSGNVKVGDCVYIGTNASVKEKLSISPNVTIGMGCRVYKDIKHQCTFIN